MPEDVDRDAKVFIMDALTNNYLTLGYSPCPNDTFIFYGLVHQKIDSGNLKFKEMLFDVETLNQKALRAELDITKVSFHAYGHLRDKYALLSSGGAMGRGCGPIVVAREKMTMDDLKGRKIAIPGRLTTAYLLLQLYDSALSDNIVVMTFNRIMDAVKSGEADAGLLIHESRFTYKDYGLFEITDLGKWWEEKTGLPIPLGCVLAKKSLGIELIRNIDILIKLSVEYALTHRGETKEYIKAHSRELADDVIEQHINLYVNNYSIDLGSDGMLAVEELFKRAEDKRIVPGD